MTKHNQLIDLLHRLVDGRQMSDRVCVENHHYICELIREILPHYDSIWISTSSAHRATFDYSRVWHIFNDKEYQELRAEHIWKIIKHAKFSREEVIRDPALEINILRNLSGEEVNLESYDDRELMFHSQLLSEAGKAQGTYTVAPYFDFKLETISEKGYDMIDDRPKNSTSSHTINISLNDNATFTGPIAIGETITQSLSAAHSVDQETLKLELENLVVLVSKLIEEKKDEEDKTDIAEQLKTFIEQAKKEKPSNKLLDVTSEGLIDAAKTITKLTDPIVASVKTILGLVTGN